MEGTQTHTPHTLPSTHTCWYLWLCEDIHWQNHLNLLATIKVKDGKRSECIHTNLTHLRPSPWLYTNHQSCTSSPTVFNYSTKYPMNQSFWRNIQEMLPFVLPLFVHRDLSISQLSKSQFMVNPPNSTTTPFPVVFHPINITQFYCRDNTLKIMLEKADCLSIKMQRKAGFYCLAVAVKKYWIYLACLPVSLSLLGVLLRWTPCSPTWGRRSERLFC